ncbi:hypothetical protein MMC24_000653 [Lignoscripta atroalba]|nr:hypothetical protein [Lignoscripta atroalba]
MRHSLRFAALAVLATSSASAQSLADLPPCATGPALASFASTGCDVTDYACICSDSAFLAGLQPVVQAACSPADLAKTIAFAQQLCASVGVTMNTGAASAPAITIAPASTSTPAPTTSMAPVSMSTIAYTNPVASASTSTAVGASPAASASASMSTVVAASSAATSATVASVISDGHPLAPTTGSTSTSVPATNSTSNVTMSTPISFEGAAASFGAQAFSVAALAGAIGAFFIL